MVMNMMDDIKSHVKDYEEEEEIASYLSKSLKKEAFDQKGLPNDNTGDIMGDVTKRRGRVLGMEPDEDGLQTIIAEVPLAELSNFTTFIRQTTQGRGWFTTEFARYEILPENLVPAVIEQAKKLGNLDEAADD